MGLSLSGLLQRVVQEKRELELGRETKRRLFCVLLLVYLLLYALEFLVARSEV